MCVLLFLLFVPGAELGVLKGDRVIQVGEIKINQSESAFDMVIEALQTSKRPVTILMSRHGRNHPEKRQARKLDRKKARKAKKNALKKAAAMTAAKKRATRIKKTFSIDVGPLGMSLLEDVTKTRCYIKSIAEHEQAWNLGFLNSDVIVSVGGQEIPATEKAMDIVTEFFQTLPRPCEVVVSRLKSIDDKAPKRTLLPDWFDSTRPLSKEVWGTKSMHVKTPIPSNQYEARWARAVTYGTSGLELKQGPPIPFPEENKAKEDNTIVTDGIRVQKVGTKANKNKGIHVLDKLVGIQTADVERETLANVTAFLTQTMKTNGETRAIVLRFQHNEDKFTLLKDAPLNAERGEYEVIFDTHPIDGGLEMIERHIQGHPASVKEGEEPLPEIIEARVHNCVENSFAAKHGISESDVIIGVGVYNVEKSAYPDVFHAIKYAAVPVTVRLLRHKPKEFSKTPGTNEVDCEIKKRHYQKKIFFAENEIFGGAYVSKVSKMKPIRKGMTLIGVNKVDISSHEWSYVDHLLTTQSKIKKPSTMKLRFGPKLPGIEDNGDDEFDEDVDGGLSLRMMLKMKKKYKTAHKEFPCKKDQYDVEFDEGVSGMQLCVAPNQPKPEDQIGAIVFSTSDMEEHYQDTIQCGDRITLINWRNVSTGNYTEIDSMLFEQLGGPTKMKIRFTKHETITAKEIEDMEKELDVELTSEDLSHESITFVTGTDDQMYCCELGNDPSIGTTLAALGLKGGDRIIGYDGVSCSNITVPGIIQHMSNVRSGKIETTTVRFQSKTPITIPEILPDIPLEENELEFFLEAGSLGLSLGETEDFNGCLVNTIQENGQGMNLGFQIYDEFKHVNNRVIPQDETAFDYTMSLLQSEKRPVRVVVYRLPANASKTSHDEQLEGKEEEMEYNMEEEQKDEEVKQEEEEMEQQDQEAEEFEFEGNFPIGEEEKSNITTNKEHSGKEMIFTLGKGPLGLSLKEISGYKGCCVDQVTAGKQGHALGFQEFDQIIAVEETAIPFDASAFDVTINSIKKEARPCRIKIYRPSLNKHTGEPLFLHEHVFTLEAGKLGLKLGFDGKVACIVKSVTAEGQAEKAGIKALDEFLSVGTTHITPNENAYQQVMAEIKKAERPLNIVVYRMTEETRQKEEQQLLEEKFQKEKIKQESKDAFAVTYKKENGEEEALFALNHEQNPKEYTLRWKNATAYKVANITYAASDLGDSEVLNHGVKANLKKGLVAMDKLIGIQNTKVVNEPHDKVMALLSAALLEAKSKPLILRFEHHADKFQPLPSKPNKREFDVKFFVHPLEDGIEFFENEKKQCIISHYDETKAMAAKGDHEALKPGLVVVGVESLSVEDSAYATVEHMLTHSEIPVTVRFRAVPSIVLPDEPKPRQRDIELIKKDYINQVVQFDTHSTGSMLVLSSRVPYIKKDETLIGVDNLDVSQLIHAEIFHTLMQKSTNTGIYKSDKKIKTMNLRVELSSSDITLEEDDKMLENEYSEKSSVDNAATLFGAAGTAKNKMSVNLVLKLKKKFKKGKLGKLKKGQYDLALTSTFGLELCGAYVDSNNDGMEDKDDHQAGSLVYHKDAMVDKHAKKKLHVGDRVVGVDGMDLYNAEHHEIDYLVSCLVWVVFGVVRCVFFVGDCDVRCVVF